MSAEEETVIVLTCDECGQQLAMRGSLAEVRAEALDLGWKKIGPTDTCDNCAVKES
jgi:hypothetical protein